MSLDVSCYFLTPEQIAQGWKMEERDDDGPVLTFQGRHYANFTIWATRDHVQFAIGAGAKPVS